MTTRKWSRRDFMQTIAAAGAGAMHPGRLGAQPAPWALRPAGTPQNLTYVVSQYGNIYDRISDQFEQDWGVKLNRVIEPNVEPAVAKLTAMFAAGDTVDVAEAPMQYFTSYIQQGIATPIDGLPGVEQYAADFTDFARAILVRDGKVWGLPYFGAVWLFVYNEELFGLAPVWWTVNS
jgi:ABC-type glycerol-3-phosphate transport system substrate-binding protein